MSEHYIRTKLDGPHSLASVNASRIYASILVTCLLILVELTSGFPVNSVSAQTQYQLKVTSQYTNGSSVSGYYTVLFQNGSVIGTGFTPASFALTSGVSYVVQVDDYGNCHFANWLDTGSTNAQRTISITANTQITAVYSCGSTISGSSVTVNSVDQNNNAVSGFYVVLFNSAGSVLSTGFTPATFATTSGTTYKIQADSYGSYNFCKWSDGVTSNPRTFTATTASLTLTAVYNCAITTTTTTTTTTTSTGSGPQLTVKSQLYGGSSITGFYTVLLQGSSVVATGFTPVTFTLASGATYQVQVQGYGSSYFQYWLDTGSVNANRVVTTSTSLSLTAVMCNGPSGYCPQPTPQNGITVYAHRIPASYWANCFATACINPLVSSTSNYTGPGASMYFVLEDASGSVLQSGLASESGYTFAGLTSGTTYYVYAANCDLCHGSNHNVTFSYWGTASGTSTSKSNPIGTTVGTNLNAWYSCTSNCA